MKINFVQVIIFEILSTISFVVSQNKTENKTSLFATNKKSNYDAAINNCKEKGGILAEIWTEDKQKEMTAFVIEYEQKNSKNTNYWIGLRKFECWVWLSDTPLCYKNWFPGEPSMLPNSKEDCGALETRGGQWAWNDFHCNEQTLAICQNE